MAAREPQQPRILKSALARPPRWYVVTRYREKTGVNASTGERVRYIVATMKYDVTEQMEHILATEPRRRKRR